MSVAETVDQGWGAAATARLGDRLVAQGLLTPDQLQEALETKARTSAFLGQVLADMGFLTSDTIGVILAEEFGVRFIDLLTVTPDPEVVRLVPEAVIRKRQVLPVRLLGDSLEVAMIDPLDTSAIDEIHLLTGRRIRPALTMAGELQRAISDAFQSQSSNGEGPDGAIGTSTVTESSLSAEIAEAPIVSIVNTIFERALGLRASDLHFDPLEDSISVRFRIDGKLLEQCVIPSNQKAAVRARIKVLCQMDITEARRPQDGHLRFELQGRTYDMRVSTLPTVFGEKIVIRVLDKSAISVPLPRLGLLPDQQHRLERMLRSPHGMVLVVGPTGSGKTTTLYSSLGMLNDGTRNIMTLEDPVEYNVLGLNQVQVNSRIGMTFAAGLRSLMRQDPDVILVGEIRDPETAEMAVQASLTGHLLLSTLHTTSAVGTLSRLTNLGVDRFLVAQALAGIVSQRLVARVCELCSAGYRPAPEMLAALDVTPEEAMTIRFRRGLGCRACYGRGYLGRIGVFEVLTLTEEIRRLVMRGASEEEIVTAAMAEGQQQLRESVLAAVREGMTTLEEMGRVVLVHHA